MIRLFNRYWSLPAALCLVVETGLLLSAVWVAYWLRFAVYFGGLDAGEPAYYSSHFLIRAGVFAGVTILCLYYGGLYDFHEQLQVSRQLAYLVRALAAAAVVLLLVYYVTFPMLTTGRGVLALAMVTSAVLLIVWRVALLWAMKQPPFGDKVLIVGTDQSALDLARELLNRRHLGYQVVGFLDPSPGMKGKSLINPSVIGAPDEVSELAMRHQADRVVVAQSDTRGVLDMDGLLECKTSGIGVETCSDYYERLTGRIMLDGLRKSWLIFSKGFVVSPTQEALKRTADIVVALVGLIVAGPVLLLSALAIGLDSRGSILFSQQRVGRDGRLFKLWKFRSMHPDAEAPGVAQWAEEDDPRITRAGRFLRRTRLDELPQLWNVLIGDMSLVGPRPERQEFVDQLSEMSEYYRQRLVVRPGITGWAQIQAPYAASFEESLVKLSYDLYYIKNLSFTLDTSILVSTIRIVLFGGGGR